MSGRGFQSVFMVGACASAALGCYLVSLRVASERASLESVETKIVLAQRDIRLLETEIGTRGRLAQLERWNVRAVQLSAPTADQFIETGFQLATLTKPETTPTVGAPVVLASAPAPAIRPTAERATSDSATLPTPSARSASDMMHVASYSAPAPVAPRLAAPRPGAATAATRANPAPKLPVASGVAAATKSIKSATADPLSPLPGAMRKAKSGAAGAASVKPAASSPKTTKESGTP